MTVFYIQKIEKALARPLTASEKAQAQDFLTAGYSVHYAVEYFK